jgi:hypothetical protein
LGAEQASAPNFRLTTRDDRSLETTPKGRLSDASGGNFHSGNVIVGQFSTDEHLERTRNIYDDCLVVVQFFGGVRLAVELDPATAAAERHPPEKSEEKRTQSLTP